MPPIPLFWPRHPCPQLVAREADSALGPVMCGDDWRTASGLLEQRCSVHGTRCISEGDHVNTRHSHSCFLLHGC
jgi:hypothetical protein